jgi:hypothetical protein
MRHPWIPVIGLVVVTVACNSGRSASVPESAVAQRAASPQRPAPAAMGLQADSAGQVGGRAAGAPPAGRGADAAAAVPASRKLIRHGTVTLEVRALDDALSRLRDLVKAANGYTTDETRQQEEHAARTASLTCRIPADGLDTILERLKSLGTVEQVTVGAEDITEQYFNEEIHLRNQRALETRLLALLDRPANRLTDLLEIEREVARVRQTIDEMEGHKRFWDSQVALSTLTVTLHEPRPAIAQHEGGILATLRGSFRQAAENLVQTSGGIIAISGALIPLGLVCLVPWWVLRRFWRRRQAVRQATATHADGSRSASSKA